jgi:hypothetical protein
VTIEAEVKVRGSRGLKLRNAGGDWKLENVRNFLL